ncbi:MAG: DUF692 domain-containing protein [Pseudomonadota bacterium]
MPVDALSLCVPPRAGVGLKPEHVDAILADPDRVGWVEIHAENYMGAGGRPHHDLSRVRERLPVSLHGVGLSIGGEGPLDADHLARLKSVADRYMPGLFSEHLAWSTHDGIYFNDLLPLPYTAATLDRVATHIEQVQAAMDRQMLLENPSRYLDFDTSTMSELDFLGALAERTGCGLLLDVNNVFISATNMGFSPEAYVDAFPLGAVGEIHLAGHAEDADEGGAMLLIDTHDRPVSDPVWLLYERVIGQTGPVPTLIEWDTDVPDWEVLATEAARADRLLAKAAERHAANAPA